MNNGTRIDTKNIKFIKLFITFITLTVSLLSLNAQAALDFFAALVARLSGESSPREQGDAMIDLGKLVALEGVKEFPSRVKCATLAWHALNSAIHNKSEPVSTE